MKDIKFDRAVGGIWPFLHKNHPRYRQQEEALQRPLEAHIRQKYLQMFEQISQEGTAPLLPCDRL
ncbi:MAG: hypothetical protein ACFCUI_10255 [Bernardetiaceae bacterium]